MSQSDLIGTIGWNSIKGLITSIILVAAFLKFMDLLGYGLIPLAHLTIFLIITFGIYYKYFWTASDIRNTPPIPYTYGNIYEYISTPRTWTDFFYTTKLDFEYVMNLITSWVCAAGVYLGLLFMAYVGSYCLDNSSSPVVISITKILVISILATCGYVYGNRYEFRKNFWKTLLTCIELGVVLSISTYALGMAIGVCGLVFGWPITIAVVILELGFTSLYTYMDLVTWSKSTHTRLIKEEEEKKIEEKRIEEEKKHNETIIDQV